MQGIFCRFKKRIAYTILLGQIFSVFMPLAAESKQEQQSQPQVPVATLYSDVANLYLKSFNVVEVSSADPSIEELLKKKQKIALQKKELSPAQLRHQTFNLLTRCSAHKNDKLEGVLDLSFVKKMELLCGQESSQAHLFSLVNRTKTVFGEAALARMLATPTADVATLKRRQAIIQELVANEELFQNLDKALELIKKSEQQMLGFWHTESQANEYLLNQVYFGSWLGLLNKNTLALEAGTRLGNFASLASFIHVPLILVFAGFGASGKVVKALKDGGSLKSLAYGSICACALADVFRGAGKVGRYYLDPRVKPFFKEVKTEKEYQEKVLKLHEDTRAKYALGNYPYSSFDYPYYSGDYYDENGYNAWKEKKAEAYKKWQEGQEAAREDWRQRMDKAEKEIAAVSSPDTLRDSLAKLNVYPPQSELPFSRNKLKLGLIGVSSLIAAYKIWDAYSLLSHEKQKNDITTYVQEKMIGVARYVRGMKKCCSLVQSNEPLKVIELLEPLEHVQYESPKNSAQFNTLLGMLDHDTFKGNPSFFSITGRALASYKVMQEAKDEFTQSMEAAGELDAYLSMAKLVKEFAKKRVGYSFVNFVAREKPMIQALDFWNPFVSPDVVVANSLWMGTEQCAGNVVITGPNTGGKSTVVKGVMLSLVLAQTFGIAPAHELTITPFAKLYCHLNISDDTAAGTSLFKAEVLKAKELITGVRALRPNEFSCVAMDEAFNGTEPKAGAEASYKFSEQLASFNNSMVLLATHFPELTKLEEAGKFKNWQVKVIRNENGTLVRPFKLEPGVSTLNVALDLLREEGVLQ